MAFYLSRLIIQTAYAIIVKTVKFEDGGDFWKGGGAYECKC